MVITDAALLLVFKRLPLQSRGVAATVSKVCKLLEVRPGATPGVRTGAACWHLCHSHLLLSAVKRVKEVVAWRRLGTELPSTLTCGVTLN